MVLTDLCAVWGIAQVVVTTGTSLMLESHAIIQHELLLLDWVCAG